MRHFVKLLGAHMVGHGGADRHQQTHQRDDDDEPDGHAQRHPGQVLRRGVSGHGNVEHGHADIGQLGHQYWPG